MTALDNIMNWMRYAQNDMIAARHMFENVYPKQTEISCYHSQQCAEKSLKAFLILNDIDPPRIHDLVELCNMCIENENSFETVLRDCDLLNPYGVPVRYPNELAIDDVVTKAAIERAQKIYDFCMGKIKGE